VVKLVSRIIGLFWMITGLEFVIKSKDFMFNLIGIPAVIIGFLLFSTGAKINIRNPNFGFLDDFNFNLKKAGAEGEERVSYALSWLSKDRYKVLNSIVLFKDGLRQEYDHIVIGKNGIFNIETKNYSGTITIDDHGNWSRTKGYGREGLESPVAQIKRHRILLEKIIGDRHNIIDVIVISNKDAIIEGISNSPVEVVKHDNIQLFIENYQGNEEIENLEGIRSKILSCRVEHKKETNVLRKAWILHREKYIFAIIGLLIIAIQISGMNPFEQLVDIFNSK
jgi:hypothetical protein